MRGVELRGPRLPALLVPLLPWGAALSLLQVRPAGAALWGHRGVRALRCPAGMRSSAAPVCSSLTPPPCAAGRCGGVCVGQQHRADFVASLQQSTSALWALRSSEAPRCCLGCV